jgi:hypothetical protein
VLKPTSFPCISSHRRLSPSTEVTCPHATGYARRHTDPTKQGSSTHKPVHLVPPSAEGPRHLWRLWDQCRKRLVGAPLYLVEILAECQSTSSGRRGQTQQVCRWWAWMSTGVDYLDLLRSTSSIRQAVSWRNVNHPDILSEPNSSNRSKDYLRGTPILKLLL